MVQYNSTNERCLPFPKMDFLSRKRVHPIMHELTSVIKRIRRLCKFGSKLVLSFYPSFYTSCYMTSCIKFHFTWRLVIFTRHPVGLGTNCVPYARKLTMHFGCGWMCSDANFQDVQYTVLSKSVDSNPSWRNVTLYQCCAQTPHFWTSLLGHCLSIQPKMGTTTTDTWKYCWPCST